MTSNDIYYRLGRIEGDIKTLQESVNENRAEIRELRKEAKGASNNNRVELKQDIADVRAALSETKTELKADIARVEKATAELSAQVQQIASSQTRTESKIDAFLWVNGTIFTLVALFIAWKTLKETRRANSEQKTQLQSLFSLDTIKGLIDYYKTGK